MEDTNKTYYMKFEVEQVERIVNLLLVKVNAKSEEDAKEKGGDYIYKHIDLIGMDREYLELQHDVDFYELVDDEDVDIAEKMYDLVVVK